MTEDPIPDETIAQRASEATEVLDRHVVDIIGWHFDPASGCPFWLEWAEKAGWYRGSHALVPAGMRAFLFVRQWL